MGTTAIKRRHRSELPIENLSEKRPGVVEPVGKLAGRTTGLLCRGCARVVGEMKLYRPTTATALEAERLEAAEDLAWDGLGAGHAPLVPVPRLGLKMAIRATNASSIAALSCSIVTASPTSALSLLFAVLVDAPEAWRGLRMRGETVARLTQLAAHPDGIRHDPELTKLAA